MNGKRSNRSGRAGSDTRAGAAVAGSAPARPAKAPRQRRSKFTVTAIYDAFVRIWRRDGPRAATMRSVALESGFAVGTLYEYFPNIDALRSGYLRHLMDGILRQLDAQVEQGQGPWRERLQRFVATCCDPAHSGWYDRDLLRLEASLATDGDHARFFERLRRRWAALLAGWDGPQPGPAEVAALVLVVWGARRYRDILGPRADLDGWVDAVTRHCERMLLVPERGPT